jgi:GxxExxY protein
MKTASEELLFKDECYKIIGLCMKVHTKLGRGYKEIIYKDALEIELKRNNIPYEREKKFKVFYDGIELKRKFIADFVVFEKIILEIKAMSSITDSSVYQTLNYIKVAGLQLALLFAFGSTSLLHRRVICTS